MDATPSPAPSDDDEDNRYRRYAICLACGLVAEVDVAEIRAARQRLFCSATTHARQEMRIYFGNKIRRIG